MDAAMRAPVERGGSLSRAVLRRAAALLQSPAHSRRPPIVQRMLGPPLCSAQHVNTGEVLMQAFADRNAICETLQTG